MSQPAGLLKQNWETLEARILSVCERVGRKRSDIQLLPVSKGHGVETILESLKLSSMPYLLGENYLDEMKTKAELLRSHEIQWHFLGKLQSRKIEDICEIADCIHTVSRSKELEILSQQNGVPSFYIQVNISQEEQKNGCEEASLHQLLEKVASLNLEAKFLGFMGMAAPIERVFESGVRAQFAKLRELRDKFAPNKKLNMGMSGDFELAIEEGSNLIRVGSLLFGERL